MTRLFFSFFFAASLPFLSAAGMDERVGLPAKINGRPVKFFFDTGAGVGCALLGYEKAAELGLKTTRPNADLVVPPGEVAVGKTEPVIFEMLGITSESQLEVLDTSTMAGSFGFDGIVGWPGLKDNLLSLNVRDNRIRIIQAPPDDVLLWEKLKIRREKKPLVLEFPAETAAESGPMVLIDTGNSGGVSLAPEAWRKWRTAHADQPATLVAFSMPGVGLRVHEEGWADELRIGGITLRGVPVREANSAEMKRAPHATLGLAALRQLNLITDDRNGYAYAQPRTERPVFYEHNRLGAVFVPANPSNNELVATVAAGSPAARTGIVSGDVLLKINELDVTPWRTKPGILPLSRFWQGKAGTSLKLKLKRGDQILTFLVILEDIIGPKST